MENDSFRKIRLTLKFMASQPGLQTIAIHILSNLSQSKQPDNEIWSINRTYQGKYFCSKIMWKMRQGD